MKTIEERAKEFSTDPFIRGELYHKSYLTLKQHLQYLYTKAAKEQQNVDYEETLKTYCEVCMYKPCKKVCDDFMRFSGTLRNQLKLTII